MAASKNNTERVYNVRPDTLDFRDKMYQASLFEVPSEISLDTYKNFNVPILDQGSEGACTGFGLATVVNYLLIKRQYISDKKPVSSRMLYEMARRYDEWPGEDYSGSSARGAMKGWHKHGVCGDDCWPYNTLSADNRLNEMRTSDALKRPLGAYYRVNHKDLVSMHSALAEVGILYATSTVHTGWNNIYPNGTIPFMQQPLGGHAFAIVAYNQQGFWIQNSWGNTWGKDGFALITYDDWLANATDVWVARLGAPVVLNKVQSTAIAYAATSGKSEAYSFADLRPHVVSLGNNGQLNAGGNFGTSKQELQSIFTDDFERVTKEWSKKRLLLYAHGGLVPESAAIQRLADYRQVMLDSEIYPVSFIWHSDAWSTFTHILQDALSRKKPEGFLDSAKDFMLDRLDDTLEPLARALTGRLQWREMKENAMLASTTTNGGAFLAIKFIKALAEKFKDDFEVHIAGHSAGSIFHAPFVRLLTAKGKITEGYLKGQTGAGLNIKTCTLWAPACTTQLFKMAYLPSVKNNSIGRLAVFNLSDDAENDDNCARIYNKSLLYLVSNAFEDRYRIPVLMPKGEPLLGMEKFIKDDPELHQLFIDQPQADLVLAPNQYKDISINYSTASKHGDFDNDEPTLKATLARILGISKVQGSMVMNASAASVKNRRLNLQANL